MKPATTTRTPVVLYGIPGCDTVRKARAWLDDHGIAYAFVDFKKTPPDRAQVGRWAAAIGVETLVNRRGTTWRKLDESVRGAAATESGAIDVLVTRPSAIRRPILDVAGVLIAGFDEARYTDVLIR